MGGRFRFDGLESTTAELKVHLEACDLDEEAHDLTTQIVEEADLIKFAKMTPGEDEARAVIAQVKNVVLTTWVEPDPEEDKEGPIFWTGPVLAGNSLWVASSRGSITRVNVADGTATEFAQIKESVTLPPIVAGGTLYLLDDSGRIRAWR